MDTASQRAKASSSEAGASIREVVRRPSEHDEIVDDIRAAELRRGLSMSLAPEEDAERIGEDAGDQRVRLGNGEADAEAEAPNDVQHHDVDVHDLHRVLDALTAPPHASSSYVFGGGLHGDDHAKGDFENDLRRF